MSGFTIPVLVVSIAVQLTATVLALRLVRRTAGAADAWLPIAVGLALMTFRRIVTLVGLQWPDVERSFRGPLAETIAFAVAVAMLLGVRRLRAVFTVLDRNAAALQAALGPLEDRVRERTTELDAARSAEQAARVRAETLAEETRTQAARVGELNAELADQNEALRLQRRELEDQKRQLEATSRKVSEADRLKGVFVANISHEIRTPLNSVLALSELLADGTAGALNDDQKKYVEVILRNGQNLLALINDILDLSRIEAGRVELTIVPHDLGDTLREVAASLRPLLQAKNLELRTRIPRDLPLALCDVDRTRQVVTNLVGNAIKFTDRGWVELAAEATPEGVRVQVADSGVGIPEAARGQLFTEFFQVDSSATRRHGGTGLGLAISSRLVRRMGAEITVESTPGQGSRFAFTLPRALAPERTPGLRATTPQERPSTPSVAPSRPGPLSTALERPLVLLVEDNEDNLFTLGKLLARLPVTVATAATGPEAVDACRKRRPDLILMDMQLPGMSGLEATRAIRELPGCNDVFVVALTAHAMKGDRERILASGFQAYLSKPIDLPELMGLVSTTLGLTERKSAAPWHASSS